MGKQSQQGQEFRELFVRKMSELGFVETWSMGGTGTLLQGHNERLGYSAKGSSWSAVVLLRGTKKAVAKVGHGENAKELVATADDAGATELARWVTENGVDPT